jgi:hypothetical protein
MTARCPRCLFSTTARKRSFIRDEVLFFVPIGAFLFQFRMPYRLVPTAGGYVHIKIHYSLGSAGLED